MVTLSGSREAARRSAFEPVEIRHVVIPLDGTPLAERAIAPAASLARALNAEITLVRAYGRSSSLPSRGGMPWGLMRANGGDLHHASLYLARLQGELRSVGIRASSRVVQAQPVEAIVEVAAHTPADLVVLATRGGTRTGERSLDGSVAADVVRNGQIPVLVVNSATANPFDAGHAGSLRLAVHVDDLAANICLRDFVRVIARVFGADVAVMRGPRFPSTSADSAAEAEDAAKGALAYLREHGVPLCVELDGNAAPAEALGTFADVHRADLVAVSGRHITPQPSADADSVLGILRHCHAPMLFVP
jgi:nucleotide-binding universal stress UspA family protein